MRGDRSVSSSARFDPAGRCLLTTWRGGRVLMYDTQTEAPPSEVVALPPRLHTIHHWMACFDPSGERIAVGVPDGEVRILDATSFETLHSLRGHTAMVYWLAYSPDGRYLASASWDHVMRVWDARTGATRLTLTGHTGRIDGCVYSPDGRRIVSGSGDRTVRVWDAETGAGLGAFVARGPIKAVVSASDDTGVCAINWAGAMYLLSLEGVESGPVILTAWRAPDDDGCALLCPLCRTWSPLPESALGTDLPCPNCGASLKLNPFAINADWRAVHTKRAPDA